MQEAGAFAISSATNKAVILLCEALEFYSAHEKVLDVVLAEHSEIRHVVPSYDYLRDHIPNRRAGGASPPSYESLFPEFLDSRASDSRPNSDDETTIPMDDASILAADSAMDEE